MLLVLRLLQQPVICTPVQASCEISPIVDGPVGGATATRLENSLQVRMRVSRMGPINNGPSFIKNRPSHELECNHGPPTAATIGRGAPPYEGCVVQPLLTPGRGGQVDGICNGGSEVAGWCIWEGQRRNSRSVASLEGWGSLAGHGEPEGSWLLPLRNDPARGYCQHPKTRRLGSIAPGQ